MRPPVDAAATLLVHLRVFKCPMPEHRSSLKVQSLKVVHTLHGRALRDVDVKASRGEPRSIDAGQIDRYSRLRSESEAICR